MTSPKDSESQDAQPANESGEFVVVYRGFEPMQAAMLVQALEAEGIVCRHIGTHHPAFIGVGEIGCEQILEVPIEDSERARELIEAFTAPGPA